MIDLHVKEEEEDDNIDTVEVHGDTGHTEDENTPEMDDMMWNC